MGTARQRDLDSRRSGKWARFHWAKIGRIGQVVFSNDDVDFILAFIYDHFVINNNNKSCLITWKCNKHNFQRLFLFLNAVPRTSILCNALIVWQSIMEHGASCNGYLSSVIKMLYLSV